VKIQRVLDYECQVGDNLIAFVIRTARELRLYCCSQHFSLANREVRRRVLSLITLCNYCEPSSVNKSVPKKSLFTSEESPMLAQTKSAHNVINPAFPNSLEPLTGMSQHAKLRFNAMTRTTKRRRGDWIFALGDPAHSIYFLQKGRMKITALSEDGQEVLHYIVGPGEFFGDTSAILGLPRTTSAQALEACLISEIYREDFETLLSICPELSLQLLKSVGLRLKKAEAQLVNVICNDVSGRVREALLDLTAKESDAGPNGPIKINMTQQDLANSIGASRQKTWEALKDLEDAGVLRLMYRSILVIAPQKLRNGQIDRFVATTANRQNASRIRPSC
jgi:CRP/FNR family cyclic AMP-dependent transcriptional regulator